MKPFHSDDSTSLDEPNLPSNLPTIPQDKEVELDIEPEVRRHTTVEVEVPPPHTTGEPEPVRRRRGRPRKNALPIQAVADISIYLQADQFKESRQKEINGLLEKGVFATVPLSTVPNGIRIFNSRFVDEVKNAGTSTAFEKSRLVVQAYNDAEKELVLTQSPTIQRVSQRLILALTATLIGSGKNLYLRDISQAYVQSDTELCRDLYIKPPTELNIAHNMVLKVIKPLYGIPEAGNHWFNTYHTHYIKELQMSQSTYDPCLLYTNTNTSATAGFGVVGLQTDDTLFIGDDVFAEAEQDKLKFQAKPREMLTKDHPIKFNGGLITLIDGKLFFNQERQCKNLTIVNCKHPLDTTSSRGIVRKGVTPKDQYVAQRARGAYIATVCQPEAAFDLSFAAQVTNPIEEDARALNKRLQWQIDNSQRGLHYVQLDQTTLQLIVFTDASFANNKDLSSQIGYVIVLADAKLNGNIIHWSSIKCKRITRSVLASELYGMAHGFDMGAVIKSTIDLVLNTTIPLVICTDSKSLYDCLVRLGTTQEKRLMVDLMCLRQSYERREIAEIKWIEGNTNPADSMTKSKACDALKQLIDTNKVNISVMEWVERK